MTRQRENPSAPVLGPDDRVAVVAGSGRLPIDVVEGLVRAGHRPLVVAVEGEVDWQVDYETHDLVTLAPEHIGHLVPVLKHEKVTHLVLAGGVGRRPPLRKIRLSPLDLVALLPRLVRAFAHGDDGLLRALIGYLESKGIKVVGAHEIVPDLLAPVGVLTRARPKTTDRWDMDAAWTAARAIGRLDIGQAAVAVGGRAIALEGIEGTDGLLVRTRDLRDHGRLAGKKRGVLVKCAKPGQELRADLPAIGPATIEAAHAAGLAGVAVEAARSLILDFDTTVKRANELELFLVGVVGEEET